MSRELCSSKACTEQCWQVIELKSLPLGAAVQSFVVARDTMLALLSWMLRRID